MKTRITSASLVAVACALSLAIGPAAAQAAWSAARARAQSANATTGLHVIPFPGTPDAEADTSIIFPSLHSSEISTVVVVGSSSGPHAGRTMELPDGAGAAWEPSTPFSPGEVVTVTATLTSTQAGAASGAPGYSTLHFSFTVADRTGTGGPPGPKPGQAPTQHFISEPHLRPPVVSASADGDNGAGDIMLSPYHGVQDGPMILNPAGQLVWFDPLPGWTANLEVQRYRGSPVLTFWHEVPHGAIDDVVMNRNYKTVATLQGGYGYRADDHEFQLEPNGTALIDTVEPVRANLSSVGGSSTGAVADCVIQELDVRTGQVLWDWHMLGHVPLSASYEHLPSNPNQSWGYCHLNSIQQLPDGNLLISARHTWGVYLVDRLTGKIIWTLGGKNSSFKLGPGVLFEWQHDARLHGSILTLFDDGWNGNRATAQQPQSSAKELSIDTKTMTATLLHAYFHTPPLISASQGNAELLASGNMFVGWGSQPNFSEYSSTGKQIFTGSLPFGVSSYRAYRFHWQGQPLTPPAMALRPGPDGTVKVYSSWNGATQVAAWRILGGANPKALRQLGKSKPSGFETVRTLHSEPPYFALQALSSSKHVLGSSTVAPDPAHVAVFGSMAFIKASQGTGSVPVGCFTGHTCQLTLQVSSGGTVLASHTGHPLPSGRSTLIAFKLSAAGKRQLASAPSHRLPVQVSVRDSSGASATVKMDLIPYTVGAGQVDRSAKQSATVQIVQDTGFVDSTGVGHILAACYSAVPCFVHADVNAHGSHIAHTAPQYLGADEVGFVAFKLDSFGQSLLSGTSDNALPAKITLSNGHVKATGEVALVGYR